MLSLADVRDWIKTLKVGDDFYIGKLDAKKEKSVGVYQRQLSSSPVIPIGGLSNKKYDMKPVSILIHWNKNARETEEASFDMFNKLLNIGSVMIGEIPIHYIRLMVPEPQDVGTDDKGVYERVIWLDLYYERKV